MANIPQIVLDAYGLDQKKIEIIPFGTGLINHTWKIKTVDLGFVLQCINQEVFKEPNDISSNIDAVGDYLTSHFPDYFFVVPSKTVAGKSIIFTEGKYYRMFPFVFDSHAKTIVNNASEAFEAAKQFGKFTKLLNRFEVKKIKITLKEFHNLLLRFDQFQEALLNGNSERIVSAQGLIKGLERYQYIVTTYQEIIVDPEFKQRATHHDTKISNILFNSDDKGICVIDLDTLMPGYFISDVGDMMRTYLCPVSEEEKNFDLINIREDIYHAIVDGYGSEMNDVLSIQEKKYYFYAGQFMIYMQALRFLTDHLSNDIYYGANYEGHNFIRAYNQFVLLEKLTEMENVLA